MCEYTRQSVALKCFAEKNYVPVVRDSWSARNLVGEMGYADSCEKPTAFPRRQDRHTRPHTHIPSGRRSEMREREREVSDESSCRRATPSLTSLSLMLHEARRHADSSPIEPANTHKEHRHAARRPFSCQDSPRRIEKRFKRDAMFDLNARRHALFRIVCEYSMQCEARSR